MEIKKDILVQAVVKKQAAKTGEHEERIWGLLEQIKNEHEDIINILTESLFGTISLNSEKTDYVVENPAADPPFKRSQNNIEVLVLKWEALLITTVNMVEAIKEKAHTETYEIIRNSTGCHLYKNSGFLFWEDASLKRTKVDVNQNKPLFLLTTEKNTDYPVLEAVTQNVEDMVLNSEKVMKKLLAGEIESFRVQCYINFSSSDPINYCINYIIRCNGQTEFNFSGNTTDSVAFKIMSEQYLTLCKSITGDAAQKAVIMIKVKNLAQECEETFHRWSDVYYNGGNNPWDEDGLVLNKIRMRIIAIRNKIKDYCSEYGFETPKVYARAIPEEMTPKYMANAEQIGKSAKETLAALESNPIYQELLKYYALSGCGVIFVDRVNTLKKAIAENNYIVMREEKKFYPSTEQYLQKMKECLDRIKEKVTI